MHFEIEYNHRLQPDMLKQAIYLRQNSQELLASASLYALVDDEIDFQPGVIQAAAIRHGQVISATRLRPIDGLTVTGLYNVDTVVTSDDFRHRGIGSQLLKLGEAAATIEGCRTLMVDCKEDLAPFFVKIGYRPSYPQTRWQQENSELTLIKELYTVNLG